MRKHFLLLSAAIALSVSACGQLPFEKDNPAMPPVNADAVNQKSLQENIGELLMVGFRGTEIDKNSHIVRDIKQYHIGGVILFEYDAPTGKHKRNISSPKQVAKLCSDLQGISPETLLIGIDQEGGNVSRLKSAYGFPKIPTAEQMAKSDSVSFYARLTDETLQGLGINLNFAPCADVNVNPKCSVIGALGRSFSSNPEEVTEYVRQWLLAGKESHILGCMKHFPGHGSADGDTHQGLVRIGKNWSREELVPYRMMIEEGLVPMIMTAHVINTEIDPETPASLSPIYVEMLRNEMHFQGVIITDDIAMGAITSQYSYPEAIRMALEAGADMLCISNNGNSYDADIVPKTIQIIEDLVKQGKLDEKSIAESANRIRKMKSMVAKSK